MIVALATLMSAFPIVWLALITYFTISNVEYNGWTDTIIGLVPRVVCWFSFFVAIAFCVIASKQHSYRALRSPWIALPLLGGIAADLTLYYLFRNSPKVWFPPTFFMWPSFAFVIAGILCAMLPNQSLHSGPAAGGRPAS